MREAAATLDIQAIIHHQRNRFPVLLIDRVIAFDPGKSATAIKCFTYNEWFFPGHFEDDPNVPGFVQIESLAQTFIMSFLCIEEYQGMKTSFVSIDNVKFKRKIVPGDVLTIEASLDSFKRGVAKGSVRSTVDGQAACSGDFVVAVPAILDRFKPRT
ncbi:3-hydroxyacyl-ACP dehydratase FabZ [Novosphingobium sp. JCM 18896]|uniref:3-hydroxyacyl-ACP dehydratase FabZ n=1 Tax=Novosphingobium sp. JCM 18896 TaxID=2989731 RepID=UPI002221931D|nr:3-hydroxyacyl-ACP dehydratase FabZ [Novosphingobium sp. JCM 18896]MCW1429393.1 3-hydroxyacyl-ACP dehydratase FabZ [Novosphingobium sp. JCM 18896]